MSDLWSEIAGTAKIKTALNALVPILEAADQADDLGWKSNNDHPDYNENAHLHITITIKEARAVRDAIKALRGKKKKRVKGCHMCADGLPKDQYGIHVDRFGEKARCTNP